MVLPKASSVLHLVGQLVNNCLFVLSVWLKVKVEVKFELAVCLHVKINKNKVGSEIQSYSRYVMQMLIS